MSKKITLPLMLVSLGLFAATCSIGCGSSTPSGGTGGKADGGGSGGKVDGGGTGGRGTGGGTGTGGRVDSGTDVQGTGGRTDSGTDVQGTGGMGTGGRADSGTDVPGTGGTGTGGRDGGIDVPATDTGTDTPAYLAGIDAPADLPANFDGSTAFDGAADASAQTRATVLCPSFPNNSTSAMNGSMEPADFCAIFVAQCAGTVDAGDCIARYTATRFAPMSTTNYGFLGTCESAHLCNAFTIDGGAVPHCMHAAGLAAPCVLP